MRARSCWQSLFCVVILIVLIDYFWLISTQRSIHQYPTSNAPYKCAVQREPILSNIVECPNYLEDLNVDCDSILEDSNQTDNNVLENWNPKQQWTDNELIEALTDCQRFKQLFCFQESSGSAEEHEFPLAFAFLVHSGAFQIIRLLQILYRPQNVFCLTYDTKSSAEFKAILHRLARCYPDNILMADVHVKVHWGHSSVMNAYWHCMRRLVSHSEVQPWKYVQMLTASDMPLRTNWEMVQILRILNGSQDVELMRDSPQRHAWVWETAEAPFVSSVLLDRLKIPANWTDKSKIRNSTKMAGVNFYQTREHKQPPSVNGRPVHFYRGSVASTLSFEFVNWLVTNGIAQDVHQYLQSAIHSEESFVATMAHNTGFGAPGTFPGSCAEEYHKDGGSRKAWISRFTVWPDQQSPSRKCHGKYVRGSCLLGIKDLPDLLKRPHLMAHKVLLDYEPALFYCMAKELHKRSTMSVKTLANANHYEQLPAVVYQHTQHAFQCTGGEDPTL